MRQVGVNLLVRGSGREVSLGGKNSAKGEAGDRLELSDTKVHGP